jgi:predicted MFS family arabinose efflux permease
MATMLFIVGTEVGGNARGTLAGILSGSGYASYAFAAAFGGFMVAQFGYGSLSFALAAATISSAGLLVFLKQSQAEDRAREYFNQAA